MSFQEEEDIQVEDAKEIVQGKPYHWRDWCMVRGRDCLYIWSDAAALELSNGSNGWFRFILDGKLATMYSSGSPEGGSDSSGETYTQIRENVENKEHWEFQLEKFVDRDLSLEWAIGFHVLLYGILVLCFNYPGKVPSFFITDIHIPVALLSFYCREQGRVFRKTATCQKSSEKRHS